VTKHIPNFITLCNLACGCYGVVAVFNGDLLTGSTMIWAGAIFDFFDGFAARMLNKFSSIGKDLDSFADIVTFCFLPSTILFALIDENSENEFLPYSGFLLVLFGALRLAKFNSDTRQSDSFYGLPVPSSAIFVSAFPYMAAENTSLFYEISINEYALILVAILLSLLMVSDIKLMSLKFKNFTLQANWHRYVLIAVSMLMLAFLQIVALPIIIMVYVVLSFTLKNIE
jgi:CDP-diacylglycerol--serine O-phosphatidyltransferase